MLRVVEQYAASDTGRQRPANEDSLLAHAPLFVVADGMGGAQAGEVASRIAIESFQQGLGDAVHPEHELAALARAANARIFELARANPEQAGMGTTLTAVYVGEQEVAIAHVGDSRAYCLRDGRLLQLTEDHSLVDELMRQGRLTPEEAVEHPQRSVITRALGPEGTVEVDTRAFRGRDGDVYLLCSDGLTTMLAEEQVRELLLAHDSLAQAGEALIAAANEAGGRDNITVVLLRVQEARLAGVQATATAAGQLQPHQGDPEATMVGVPAVVAPLPRSTTATPPLAAETPPPAQPLAGRRLPRTGAPADAEAPRRRRLRRARRASLALVVLAVLGSAGYLALQTVYFVGTDERGLVTMFEGLPYELPGGIALYSRKYVSGVSAATLTPAQRHRLLSHTWRSEANAATLIRNVELEQIE